MQLNRVLKKVVRFGYNSPEKKNYYLSLIRNAEWDSVKQYIPKKSKFLDIGCGSGFSMMKAIEDRECNAIGIDPKPLMWGVKFNEYHNEDLVIKQGDAEQLPFENNSFEVVFSSHVLEHVNNYQSSLKEMNRVLKENGTIVLGVPTSTLAWLGLLPQLLFTTHIRIANYILSFFTKNNEIKFINIFLPGSHSESNKTVLYDLRHYRIGEWRKKVSSEFSIVNEIKPAFFCFADFIIFFIIRKKIKYSSSVFFICHKKPKNIF
jgi:SAM-dependent methyltransferase